MCKISKYSCCYFISSNHKFNSALIHPFTKGVINLSLSPENVDLIHIDNNAMLFSLLEISEFDSLLPNIVKLKVKHI